DGEGSQRERLPAAEPVDRDRLHRFLRCPRSSRRSGRYFRSAYVRDSYSGSSLESRWLKATRLAERLSGIVGSVSDAILPLAQAIKRVSEPTPEARTPAPRHAAPAQPAVQPTPATARTRERPASDPALATETVIGKPQQRMLNALGWWITMGVVQPDRYQ